MKFYTKLNPVNKGLVLLLAAFVMITIACNKNKNTSQRVKHKFNYSEKYEKQWAKVDSLESKRLFRSALNEVKEIKSLALQTENTPQGVKAIMYELKYNTYLEEDDYDLAIQNLDSMTSKATFPMKDILHSVTAEVYYSYYQNNQYKILDRTPVDKHENHDFKFWDAKLFESKINEQYFYSLASTVDLQQVKIDDFEDMLNYQKETTNLRPTLYDFLAFRALNHFKRNPFELNDIANNELLNDDIAFDKIRAFTSHRFVEPTNNTKILTYFQDIISFHIKDYNDEALLDANLMRLKFVYDHYNEEEKDRLYIAELNDLYEKHADKPRSTEIQYALAKYHNQNGQNYDPKKEENKYELKNAVEICKKAIEFYPESYGAKKCGDLLHIITQKTTNIELVNCIKPNSPAPIKINTKNVYDFYFKIVKLNWNEKIKDREDETIYLDKILNAEAVKKWQNTIENPMDYRNHSTVMNIPELPYGHYAIILSSVENPINLTDEISYAKFWVTDLSLTYRDGDEMDEYNVLHRQSGKTMDNVKIDLYQQKKYNKGFKIIDQLESKDGGVFSRKSSNSYRSGFVHLHNNEDHYVERFREGYHHNYEEQATTKTHFFLDRAIYRPGQTVYFKGLKIRSTDNEHEVVKNNLSKVTLYDVNHQIVSSLNLTSNEYGSFNGSFVLPQGLLNGQMHIEDKDGSIYFSVEEYKRPKFEVNINPIEGSYKLEEQVTLTGIAKAFAGFNIGDAKVDYKVRRTARFPYWCWHRWGHTPTSNSLEITNGVTKTNDDGEFTIRFKAIADESVEAKYAPTYTYEVTADVTDINGETRSVTEYVSVGYTAMELTAEIGETVNGDNFTFVNIGAKNLNGQPIIVKGKLTIHRLIEPRNRYRKSFWSAPDLPFYSEKEFHELFPLDLYDKENEIGSMPREQVKIVSDFETYEEANVAFEKGTTWEQGHYILRMISTDTYGSEVEEIKYFTVYSPENGKCAVNKTDWFTPLITKAEPGEDASFLIGTGEDEVSVLYEVERQGQIISSERFTLNREQRLITVPITEEDRGNISVHFTFVKNNRIYKHDETITVPYTNKELDIVFETFRNKLLPGQEEEWRLKIKGKNGDEVMAELMTTLYDASLDDFRSNDYVLNIWKSYYSRLKWNSLSFLKASSRNNYINHQHEFTSERNYSTLNWFGYNSYSIFGNRGRGNYMMAKGVEGELMMADSQPMMDGAIVTESQNLINNDSDDIAIEKNKALPPKNEEKQKPEQPIKARTNFNETAFFFPAMTTNKEGEIIIKFTIPESLTRWKLLGLAHTTDLKTGRIEKEIITQKKLMITPNIPRFLRAGDEIALTTKITNLTRTKMNGNVQLYLYDALTMQPIDSMFYKNDMRARKQQQGFVISPEKSTVRTWKMNIPEGVDVITYKIIAQTNDFSDGEENAIPILTNRTLVTESLPLPIRGNETKTFSLDKLVASGKSKSLRNHSLTLEFTSNPAWYAVQAMPYMMDYPYDCAEQTFTKFYSNALASHIMDRNPKIKRVFDDWVAVSPTGDKPKQALLSNLEKNKELKSALLEETPWVMEAKDESERKKRLALLFDLNKMNSEMEAMLNKLIETQSNSGAWPWFKGMNDNRYITQHIVTGLGHLDHLNVRAVRENPKVWAMLTKAIGYLDTQIDADFNQAVKHDRNYLENQHIGNLQVQYLYARSYFKDVTPVQGSEIAFNYYLKQANKYWTEFNLYGQGMIALQANRNLELLTARDILKSIKELAIQDEEFGMYWKDLTQGYYWYQAPIETQALLMEMFDEVADDQNSVEEMKIWLLKQKQTSDWKTTKATTEAVYALLMRGTDGLTDSTPVNIEVGGNTIRQDKVEAGTGYFKQVWHEDQIRPKMGNVDVSKTTDGIAWGALYWQYFEDLDKITPATTGLSLKKEIFVVRRTNSGERMTPIAELNSSSDDNSDEKKESVKVGDKIRIRIELSSDRNLEYVHLKDMRASGLEPVNVISTYKWQGGLGYYESTKDASTNFFMDFIPKGTYVFEYDLRVSHAGDFSNGISSIQCMYAPEFTSHSKGERVVFE